MDRLPHGGSWPFFGAHSLRDDAKTPAKRVALAGQPQPSLAQLLPCYRGVMGFWEHLGGGPGYAYFRVGTVLF